jgi:hypothetical protein
MAKQAPRPTAKTAETKNENSAGLTFKTPITNPLHQGVGNRNPEALRAINILANNAKQQLDWAEQEKKAAELLNDYRKKIEKIRSEIEKDHFQTEKQIDELVMSAELANEAYKAHQKEISARKAENVKFIEAAAQEEIQIVSHEFSERIRSWKTKTDVKKQAATTKYNAEIEQEKARGVRQTDPSEAQARAIAAQKMKAFIAGKPMAEVEAIGGQGVNQGSQQVALLDRFSFDFGRG